MIKINYGAVVVAAIAAFVMGAVWYSPVLFGNTYMTLRGISTGAIAETNPPPAVLIAEFVRCLIVAYVLARFVVRLKVVGWMDALLLGAWVWLGFQAMAIVGSVIHENYPWQLYAIHAGDALVKTLLITVILAVWRKRQPSSKGA